MTRIGLLEEIPRSGVQIPRTHISYIMFGIRHNVCLLIPIVLSEENPPNVFNHAVIVTVDFIYAGLLMFGTDCDQDRIT